MAEKKNGTRPIDRVTQSYRSKRKQVVVEEWDGLELYFGPLTTADVKGVEKQMRARHGDDPSKWSETERRLRLLINKAELEDGSQAFDSGDMHTLETKAEYVVLQKLVAAMYTSAMSLEDAKKKSEKTSDSGSS